MSFATSKLEAEFLGLMQVLDRAGHLRAYKREWKFHRGRKWRFDFAWPAARVAVELEGGTYSRGRHVRPAGFAADCEKYNAAALDGWLVLRYTAADLRGRPVQVIGEVVQAVTRREAV